MGFNSVFKGLTHAKPEATGVHEPNKAESGLVRVIYFREPSREPPEVT